MSLPDERAALESLLRERSRSAQPYQTKRLWLTESPREEPEDDADGDPES